MKKESWLRRLRSIIWPLVERSGIGCSGLFEGVAADMSTFLLKRRCSKRGPRGVNMIGYAG